MNTKNNKASKNDILDVAHSQELASSRIFPMYDTKKEMMEFMIVSPHN